MTNLSNQFKHPQSFSEVF